MDSQQVSRTVGQQDSKTAVWGLKLGLGQGSSAGGRGGERRKRNSSNYHLLISWYLNYITSGIGERHY